MEGHCVAYYGRVYRSHTGLLGGAQAGELGLALQVRIVILLSLMRSLTPERNAEHEYAVEQAKELVLQLESLKLPIDVLRGKKTIEVRPRGINKVRFPLFSFTCSRSSRAP